MNKLIYKKINAFTTHSSTGNPAACIYLDENQVLTEMEMLNIAKEHKGFVSEVVYCTPKSDNTYMLKYYSSECEVEFCGHGTIACAYDLLKNSENLLKLPEIIIDTKKGKLTVYNEINTLNAVFITAPDPQYLSHKLDADIIAKALQIMPHAISKEYPISLINGGLNTLLVPISSLKDELSNCPNEYDLKAFCLMNSIDIILTFTMEVFDIRNKVRTRVFAPKFGYLEDMATGSGNSALGYYMLKHDMWDGQPISIEQNAQPSAHNIVWLKTHKGKVLFGGGATVRIEGKYIC